LNVRGIVERSASSVQDGALLDRRSIFSHFERPRRARFMVRVVLSVDWTVPFVAGEVNHGV